MANFPTSLPSITNPTANDTLAAVPHHTQHGTANDEIAAIAAKMGTGSSTPAFNKRMVSIATGTSKWAALPEYTVTDHGLVGDNSTSNTAAWAALTALVDAAGGGRIVFPAGIFLGVFPVAYDDIHVRGAGWDTTILKSSTGSVMEVTGDYCSVGDIMFAGGGGDDGTGGATNCLLLTGAYGFYAENLWVTRAEYGIRLTGSGSSATSHAARFVNIAVSRCGTYGIDLSSWAYDGQYLNIWIGLCDIGLRVNDGANRFTNLHVWGSYGGDNIKVPVGYNHFQNVYVEKGGYVDGVRTDGVGDGFEISSSYNTISGGLVANNGGFGVHIDGGTHNVISGLTVYNNLKGVRLINSATDNTIANVQCFDTQGTKTQLHGIEVNTGCTGTILSGIRANDADHVTSGVSYAAGTVDFVQTADDVVMLGDMTADRFVAAATSGYRFASTTGNRIVSGSGTPENSVSAPVGSLYLDTTNGVAYIKNAGSSNTGWKLVTQAA